MKFGKHIQAEQVPGWSQYYLDYKFLKKIVSSLAANRPGSEAAALAIGIRPSDILNTPSTPNSPAPWDANAPSLLSAMGRDEEKGPDFQAHKAAFFFRLERELEKINAFYLQKEAELKLRLETLLSKRRAAAMRVLPVAGDDDTRDHVEWNAVEEGLRLLERDLGKLQHYIEVNATGFRKILKKWDKRSKSQTKELYLARQVDVQPVFNRQLISELSDTVAACLLDLTDLSRGLNYEIPAANDVILSRQLNNERSTEMRPFHDLERSLRNAVQSSDEDGIRNLIRYSDTLLSQPGGKINVTRILWKTAIDSPPDLADLILSTPANSFDFLFVDDINGRTCLHQAAMVGMLRLVDMCLEKSVPPENVDAYGRSALHYATMNGHAAVCRRLLESKVPPGIVDMDNYTPLIHATLKGSVDCIRVLLDDGGVAVQPESVSADLFPLSLASRTGHLDVVLLLLERGAQSVPNSNGEYPAHLAAKEGHMEICRLLVRHGGWDVPDKYNEWTPLFHAARYGHANCIRVFLEAGCHFNAVDEIGNSPVHYAAWYGHQECVALLLAAGSNVRTTHRAPRPETVSVPTEMEVETEDIDMIPSLSLPPPIMPYRVYGHNYLDKNCLVQITIGQDSRIPTDSTPAVRLYPPFMGSEYQELYLHSSPLFKLVMTATPDVTSAPYSIPLPLPKEGVLFAFQVPSLDVLSLEFSLYPNFGTKTIGRAVALPSLLQNVEKGKVLPILDHRLHVIGEVSIGVNVITPFQGVTLEIGGAVETYWKSTGTSAVDPVRSSSWLRAPSASRSPSSAQTSPSNYSVATGGLSKIISSIAGEHAYVVIQVTRDNQPVAYPHWKLPVGDFDLGVSDVSLEQFENLARRSGRNLDLNGDQPTTTAQWHRLIYRSMISLAELIALIPPAFGLCLELAYEPPISRDRASLRTQLNLNLVVDSLLRTIYQLSPEYSSERRRIVFTSFSPDTCAALNWKQPNYPVFFATGCGWENTSWPSPTALGYRDADGDQRLGSMASAVNFAKSNNLLGVMLEADLLVKVPSLIDGMKDAGLLVTTWGSADMLTSVSSTYESSEGKLDAFLREGVLVFLQHPK